MTNPESAEWRRMLAVLRRKVASLRSGDIPSSPGVYAWFHDGRCVYLGKAFNLRTRLGTHLRTSLDLSRSTLRSWVAVRELGLAREFTRRRPSVMSVDEVAVVNAWIAECDLAWLSTATKAEAASLEKSLLADWRPPINVA